MVCFPKTFVFAARAFPFAFRTPSCDAPDGDGDAHRDPGDSYPRRESRVRDRLDSRETRALAEEPAAGDARTARATPHARTGGAKRERVQNIAAGNNVNLDSHRHDTSNSKLTRARGVV